MPGETEKGTVVAPTVVGTIELTPEDLIAATVELSWMLRLRTIFLVVALGVYGVVWMTGGPAPSESLPVLAVVLLFWAIVVVTPRYRARRAIRSLAARGDINVSYRFDDAGVTIRSAGATATFAYRTLVKVREGKTAFVLYTTPLLGNIVPKRAFASEEIPQVRSYLAAATKVRSMAGFPVKGLLAWLLLVLMFLAIWQFLSPSSPPAGTMGHPAAASSTPPR
jgi:hypothetical protein